MTQDGDAFTQTQTHRRKRARGHLDAALAAGKRATTHHHSLRLAVGSTSSLHQPSRQAWLCCNLPCPAAVRCVMRRVVSRSRQTPSTARRLSVFAPAGRLCAANCALRNRRMKKKRPCNRDPPLPIKPSSPSNAVHSHMPPPRCTCTARTLASSPRHEAPSAFVHSFLGCRHLRTMRCAELAKRHDQTRQGATHLELER